MAEAKLNPSLFEKLTLNDRVTGIVEEGRVELQGGGGQTLLRLNSGPQLIERYNETAMRASVRRELGWLLNTVYLEASIDLDPYPQVKTSVLNYGMPDLTGRASTLTAVRSRANQIADQIRIFEPRLDGENLDVTAEPGVGLDNAVAYMIRGDVTSAVRAMPVQFFANVEVETGEAVVRE
jgi:type VI secretion system protein ImpF